MCLTANSNKLKQKKWNCLTTFDKLVHSTHANFAFVTRALRSENIFPDIHEVYLKCSYWKNFGGMPIFFLNWRKATSHCTAMLFCFSNLARDLWAWSMTCTLVTRLPTRKTGTIHLNIPAVFSVFSSPTNFSDMHKLVLSGNNLTTNQLKYLEDLILENQLNELPETVGELIRVAILKWNSWSCQMSCCSWSREIYIYTALLIAFDLHMHHKSI